MTLAQALFAFVIAAGLLTITPGLDTLMILRTATIEGPRRAAFAAAGIGLGCLVWGAIVALGIGAMLATAPMLFTLIRWAGAAYLALIGIGLLLRPRDALSTNSKPLAAVGGGAAIWFRRGLLTNLLNPKMGVFYISFLPQFVPHGYAAPGLIFLLACLHLVMGMLWLATLIVASLPLGRLLGRPPVLRALDRVTGGLFVAFGIRLAVTR